MPDKKDILSHVFCNVLEMQAFMFAEPAERTELPQDVEDCVITKIGYQGDQNGDIEMAVPNNMSIELAANILGMDMDDEFAESKSEDALKELLNIICGNVITDVFGETAKISPTIPEMQKLRQSDWTGYLKDENSLFFVIDEIPVILRIA